MLKVGILGCGQLALMLAQAAKSLNIEIICFSPSNSFNKTTTLKWIQASFDDLIALKRFIDDVEVLTIETENIPLEILKVVAESNKLMPGISAIATAQDRLFEKKLFNQLKIPTNEYLAVDTLEELDDAAQQLKFPFILKTRTQGYDGKGQYIFRDQAELDEQRQKNQLLMTAGTTFIAEEMIPFDLEVSIISVRDKQGQVGFYDLCHNTHQQGILRQTKNIQHQQWQKQAKRHIETLLEHFEYVGVLTIEFFVLDGQLIANEMAPRVHNSGHWTIEGTDCSQFENHLRAICGLTVGSCQSANYALMLNLIGGDDLKNQVASKDWSHHDYLKQHRPGRKVGHLTATFQTEAERTKTEMQL